MKNILMAIGLIVVVSSPLTVLGMVYDNADYWLAYDIVVIVLSPILGVILIYQARKITKNT